MATDLIDSYSVWLRSKSAADRTIADRRRTLLALDRDLPHGLESACADELIAWLWREGLSMGSRETYYSAINSFFSWAYATSILDFDPAEQISRPKVPRRLPNPVTDDQLMSVLGTAAEPYRTWAILAAYAGLRCIEISRLNREHVTEQSIRLVGKGGKVRVVPTHPAIWAVVQPLPQGPIAPFDARFISIRSAVYFSRKLKMKGVHMHRFRHWFGTTIQRGHKDLRVTQELMGHANPATTAGYALVADEDMTTAVNVLPVLTTV